LAGKIPVLCTDAAKKLHKYDLNTEKQALFQQVLRNMEQACKK
jgi:hypothetical protein